MIGNTKSFTRSDGLKVVIDYSAPSSSDVGQSQEQQMLVYDSLGDYVEKSPLDTPQLGRELRERLYEVYHESLELRGGRSPRAIELDDDTLERL